MGAYQSTTGVQTTLAEEWNGSGWVLQPTPRPSGAKTSIFSTVSCPAPTACVAVGDYVNSAGVEVTLAEQWNGSGWVIQPTPNPSGATRSALLGVSCTSAGACTAVGSYVNSSGAGQVLAEVWNGSAWAIQPTVPTGAASLARVSCTSPTACTAVGSNTLVERWNGSSWQIQPLAIPPGATATTIYGVTCTTATLCTAVGHWSEIKCNNGQPTCNCFRWPFCTYRQSALAEQWNGSAWTITPTPTIGILGDVSCTAANACTATGYAGSGTLAERWNGAAWQVQTTPAPPGFSTLSSVSCTSSTLCTAVGYNGGATLAEQWNGTSWQVQSIPTPHGPANPSVAGVSCPTATACTAVGSYSNPSGATVTLAEGWNGSAWLVQSAQNPAGPMSSSLTGVSCTATACTAVGAYFDTTVGGNPPPDLALAEGWNGTSWAIQSTPSPGAGYNTALSGVSCTAAAACMAVGYDYYNQGPQDTLLAEYWNGTAWSIQNPPVPSGAYSSSLASVSCPTATTCIAVGTWNDAGVPEPLAKLWNGSAWSIQSSPVPSGAYSSSLASVSCATATACVAVGTWSNAGVAEPLAEVWNGTTWSIQAPPGAGGLTSVSCPATNACMAVGDPGIEHWDGTTWTVEPAPSPPGVASSNLTGVSCTTTTACAAVGSYVNPSGARLTLADRYAG